MTAELNRIEQDGIPVLSVVGRLSLDDLDAFQDELHSLGRTQARHAIVDLLACPFLASRVFPTILKASEAMERAGRTLLIACPDDLYRILEILRLQEHLSVYPTRERCLEVAKRDG